MEPTKLGTIAAWAQGALLQLTCDGELVAAENSVQERLVSSLSTDSRKVRPGDVFWPLVGERFDGHDYIAAAIDAGARCSACAREKLPVVARTLLQQFSPDLLRDLTLIVVEDTLQALSFLASGYRQQFSIPVVAVTGSVGKTTTKDLAAAVLSRRLFTLKTVGNFNNEVGLPLTLLGLTHAHEAAVVEMGMRGKGQISALAATAQPTVGVVTSVEPVHVELLGSLEAIAQAKQELVQSLPVDGTAILNWDNMWVRKMVKVAPCRVFTFGSSTEADLVIDRVESAGDKGIDVAFLWQHREYCAHVPIPGKHNAYNAAAAVLAGIACGLEVEECVLGLSDYKGSAWRMEITSGQDGTVIVNDAYNANPYAMRAAINATLDIAQDRRVWLILGDMLELGQMAESAHTDLGYWAGTQKVEKMICVGQYGEHVAAGAKLAGFPASQIAVLPDAATCAKYLENEHWRGAVILIKGSRGVGLEQVAEYCIQRVSPGK